MPVRNCPETTQALHPHHNPQSENRYSDRIATMARHAAVSFDSGYVAPADFLEEPQRQYYRQQVPPAIITQAAESSRHPIRPTASYDDRRMQFNG